MTDPTRPAAPRLSICIATMNRAADIGGTLERIARQIDGAGEVVILDGSRDDATARVVEGFRDRIPALRYERQPPQGVDRDYARVIDLAAGDYCWPFTDDDWLLPGAYAAVQRLLAREPDCVVVNFQYWNPAMDRLLLANYLGFEEDREYPAGQYEDFARDTLFATSFIASLVVRRTLWQQRDGTAYFGTEFAHVGRIFQQPLTGPTAVAGRPAIAARLGVSQWTTDGLRIWMVAWPKLVWSLPGMSEAAREKATAREPWRNVKRLVRLRATGSLSAADYDRWLRPLPLGWRLRATVWVLSRLPMELVNHCARFYVRRFRPHLELYRAELEGAIELRRRRRRPAA